MWQDLIIEEMLSYLQWRNYICLVILICLIIILLFGFCFDKKNKSYLYLVIDNTINSHVGLFCLYKWWFVHKYEQLRLYIYNSTKN